MISRYLNGYRKKYPGKINQGKNINNNEDTYRKVQKLRLVKRTTIKLILFLTSFVVCY